jgi:hypothetical protein
MKTKNDEAHEAIALLPQQIPNALSASNLDHRSILCGRKDVHVGMRKQFPPNCRLNKTPEILVCGSFPYRLPQAHFGRSKQADLEVAVGHEAHTVALGTEVLRHACDERHRALVATQREVLCDLAPGILHLRQGAGVLLN